MAKGEKVIGIDLGTTFSVVAVMEGGEAKVIHNKEGNRLTPSMVAFTEKGETLVGEPARRQAITNPKRTIYSIKRFMGHRHSEVSAEEKIVPYEVVGEPEDFVKVRVGDRQHTPPEISAEVLRAIARHTNPASTLDHANQHTAAGNRSDAADAEQLLHQRAALLNGPLGWLKLV